MWWSSVASAGPSSFMPPDGTAIASQVDKIYGFLLVSSLISFIVLMGGFIYFAWKYRRRSSKDKTAYITHNHTLEFLWSFVPFVIFMFSFAWGWVVYSQMRDIPPEGSNALEVNVIAKKWAWKFQYKNGKTVTSGVDAQGKPDPATMVVPINRPVRLILQSQRINESPDNLDEKDRAVLHSFYIPAFRIKQDVVPGRFTAEWFTSDKLGEYWVFCTEYCGAGHSSMKARIKVVSNEDFEKWLGSDDAAGGTLADQGRAIYGAKACVGCHSIDGSRVVGPTFKGIWGQMVDTDKGSVKIDEDYIRESILQPNAKIVAGYPAGVMPTFAGQLSDDDIKAVIEFIKSVK